ncbi:MAG TPA: HypC/HybG/HupF family hydrogenase formation chaperone [Aestuariivirga sp.]|nr:HypC/HybG/HupF family hydrogenase formation chaperone [Alphaproteobacteria bacterium]HRX35929.1 HypC/HybG/HupF family hydrogenase formation chaperone [Aestuariivirga sp.]
MCLAIPAKILSLEGDAMAVVSFEGVKKRISLALVDDAAVGDYVLIHVGFALHKVSPEDAERTLALMAEAGILSDEIGEMAGPPS